MSFWRGPFQITRKLSEVLYEVNCGREGQRQIIHCDRLRRKIVQNLRGENDVETSVENELDEVVNDLESENLEEVDDLVQESRRPKAGRNTMTMFVKIMLYIMYIKLTLGHCK